MAITNSVTKKATNITLSADVLAEAKALNINISQACDRYLRDLVRGEREKRWHTPRPALFARRNPLKKAKSGNNLYF